MNEKNNKLSRILLLCVLLLLIGGSLFFSIKKLKFDESYSSILPVNEQNEFLVELLDSASFFDRMVVHIYSPDSTTPQPNKLVKLAEQISDSIRQNFIPEYIESIEGKTRSDIQQVIFNNFSNYLPIYLKDADYNRIDSLINSNNLSPLVKEHLKVLNSPAGYMASKFLFADPLGIISKQYSRLEDLKVDDNLIIYKNYLLSKDKRHLTFFLVPVDAGNTGKNTPFVEELNAQIKQIQALQKDSIYIEYTGSLPIATANASQIKRDIQLTINMAILVIVLLILYFYRRWQYLGLVLLPALIGATIALAVFSIFYGKISAISLGIGSVLLGISVDYALHIFTHLKHSANVRAVIKDVTLPIMMSSLTTGSAFLGLLALSSPAVRQLGIFAAISVITSALFSIFILPFLLKKKSQPLKINTNTIIEKIASYEYVSKKWNVILILALTVFFWIFISRVSFEDDFEKLNYMPEYLENAVVNLDKAGDFSGKKSYLLSAGHTTNEAIENANQGTAILDSLVQTGTIKHYNSALSLVASEKDQLKRINKWNSFWTPKKKLQFNNLLGKAAKEHHIKPKAYSKFITAVNKNYKPVSPDTILAGFGKLTESFKLSAGNEVYLAHIIHVEDSLRKTVSDVFLKNEPNHLIDKKVFFSSLFDGLLADFDQLIYISFIVVFAIILIFLGRVELALITFLPILVSWLWTLGFIGLFNIKLNFFNIVVCSLVFGLGIDYAIFVTRGLMQEYKTGINKLASYKSSILLSGITTLVGLGVLLLAKHPALKSIASLAIVGILSSIIIVFSLQPILFRFLIGSRNQKRKYPLTLTGSIRSKNKKQDYSYRIKQNFIYKGPVLEHYIKVKIGLEKNYRTFDDIVPIAGKIYDLGCGYGIMSMMLKMTSLERDIIGLDYDEEKIATAKNTQLNQELKIDFRSGDALELKMTGAEAIIISDMLHYLKPEEQGKLLKNCYNGLSNKGKLIIRDGDASKTERHKGTRLSEFLSTNIGFNKTRNTLNFFTQAYIETFAQKYDLSFKVIDESKRTSNLIYVLSKK